MTRNDLPAEMDAADYVALMAREHGLSVPESAEKPKRKRKPKPPTSMTEFRDYLLTGGYGPVIEEHRFHPTRRWRFDFFLPDHNIAFEYDGLMRHGENQGHASIGGILRDTEKINEAQAMGIKVFRVNAKSVQDGSAFELVQRVLSETENASNHAEKVVK